MPEPWVDKSPDYIVAKMINYIVDEKLKIFYKQIKEEIKEEIKKEFDERNNNRTNDRGT